MRKLLYIFILFCIVSCTTPKTVIVPLEHIRTEYINTTDSVFIKDSVYISYKEKGDTVYQDRFRYIYKTKITRDTVLVHDTTMVVKELEKPIKVNELKNWQKYLMYFGGAMLGLFGLFFLYKLFKIFR